MLVACPISQSFQNKHTDQYPPVTYNFKSKQQKTSLWVTCRDQARLVFLSRNISVKSPWALSYFWGWVLGILLSSMRESPSGHVGPPPELQTGLQRHSRERLGKTWREVFPEHSTPKVPAGWWLGHNCKQSRRASENSILQTASRKMPSWLWAAHSTPYARAFQGEPSKCVLSVAQGHV